MIYFSAGLLISVGDPLPELSQSNVHVSMEWQNQKGVQTRIENFFEGGSNFAEDGSFG